MQLLFTVTGNITVDTSNLYKWYEQIHNIFTNSMRNPMWLPLMPIGVTLDTVTNRERHTLGIDQPSF